MKVLKRDIFSILCSNFQFLFRVLVYTNVYRAGSVIVFSYVSDLYKGISLIFFTFSFSVTVKQFNENGFPTTACTGEDTVEQRVWHKTWR